VVVLDRRVMSKSYGRMFLDSLPLCTVRQAPLSQLARDAARWIDGQPAPSPAQTGGLSPV
jgi:DNA polymerase-3 subunit epsilon/ATP-dependent DNA helicase DinG